MIPEKMVLLIKDNADEITKRLCKDLFSRQENGSYHLLNEDVVYERAYEVYNKLDSWLKGDKTRAGEMRDYFTKLGRKRFHEGIPIHEEIMTLMLIKRHLWLYVLEKHVLDSSFELQQALQFNNRVVLFFDRVIFFVTSGYEKERAGKPDRS